ncbi:MAG: insulinase family protein [bacterium]|nr:insulinase family protein [bacterium]
MSAAAVEVGSPRLPIDPDVRKGQLANGLTYIIRKNGKPENRAELRLVVNAGSILEEEDQQGLAHFAEHMAFNGTSHFPKQELVDFIESIGMRFGADLNAYTSFDETVYMLQVPTDSAEVMRKAFQILGDWAHEVSFVDEEIEKERGVVVEEWRTRRGAGARMRDRQLPILLKDSQYATRLPIGQKALLDTFHHESLKRFYKDWYRPDLMSVIAVGDFDPDAVERAIADNFGDLVKADPVRERDVYTIPDHEETLFAIATDPEATSTSVSIYYMQPIPTQGTREDYRQSLIRSMFNSMLNQRLSELTKKPDPPFLGAGSSFGSLVRTKAAYTLGAGVAEGGIERGLEAVLTEALRVRRHGFTAPELDRLKVNMLRGIEQSYRERDKSRSGGFASEYIRHVLTGEDIPGIAYEYGLYNELVPAIQVEEINAMVDRWIAPNNRVIMVNAPEKEGVAVPGEADLLAVLARAEEKDIPPYEENVSSEPLVGEIPNPGSVLMESRIEALNVTEWVLSNGVRVVMKPTDFKNDEVLFTSYSPGGHSLVDDQDYIAATTAVSVLAESGLGKFDQIELGKKLAGKVVRVSAGIGSLTESLSGSASPQDLGTMFQLIYLKFMSPRADSSAFVAFEDRIRGMLQNRNLSPDAAFNDTIQVTMSQYDIRSRPFSMQVLEEMDLQKSLAIYKDRFADASDFTFVLVGNFEPEKIRPLVERYLGGLPALIRNETARNVAARPPVGIVEKTVARGREPKSRTVIQFTGEFEWGDRLHRYRFDAMVDVLRIKLREVLREDEGGTYGVGVRGSSWQHPEPRYNISISFGCDPERLDALTKLVFAQIDSMKLTPVDQSYVDKVTETDLRTRETDFKENSYWRGALRSAYEEYWDPIEVLTYADEVIRKLNLSDVQAAANRYLNTENYARFSLVPEPGLIENPETK